jgi:hypothetical protein
MPGLTEKHLRYGYFYYHKDEPKRKTVTELADYAGEKDLAVCCTQLDSAYTVKNRKRILSEWCDFLKNNPAAFQSLYFGSRVPQELFDAACCQKNLETLYIKWGAYHDISALQNLEHIKHLGIGSGAGVENIEALGGLENLVVLWIENFQKIRDYSVLKKLSNLEELNLTGDGLSPQYIHIDDLDFLREMPALRHLYITTVRLSSHSFLPVTHLARLQFLTLPSHRDVKKDYSRIISALPLLRYGLLIEKPELYA